VRSFGGPNASSWISCAHPAGKINASGRGPAWLGRLTGGQEVGGSNPPGPTTGACRYLVLVSLMMGTRSPARSWSDEELRGAVASQRSWRGTARALGLRATSAGAIRTLKRHAYRLALDTSHFTHQRLWSDRQLRGAIEEGETWSEVLHLLGLSDRADARVRVKGHAVRLGLDIGHLQPRAVDPPAGTWLDLQPHRSALRTAAEPLAIAWFALRDIPVAVPAQPCAYDLVATLPSGARRIQVKSSTHRDRSGTWRVGLGQRPYVLDKTARRIPYDPDEVDDFFIVDGDGVLYLVPSSVVAGRTAIHVGPYRAYRVGDASSLLQATMSGH
jgi:hypothetical protein